MELKYNLGRMRNRLGVSQEWLAEKMSVSRQTISKWENGDAYPSTEHILELRKIFGCTFDELVDGELPRKMNKSMRIFDFPKKWAFLVVGFALMCGLIIGCGFSNLKFVASHNLVEEFIFGLDGLSKENETYKLVGYGISEADGSFYIKCNVYGGTASHDPCSAIIYFCKDGDRYSYDCQYFDDLDYHPEGEYYQIV